MEPLTAPAAPRLCPPHHWLIEGSATLAGHQTWTCYRCGLVRPQQEAAQTSYHHFSGNRLPRPRPTPAVPGAGDAADIVS